MSLNAFKLHRPRSLADALDLLAKHSARDKNDIKVCAGGTDLLPSMKQRLFTPGHLLDISAVPEMNGIREEPGALSIGALTRLSEIEHSPMLRKKYSVLTEAAATVASPILRNMGTLGGNLCLDTRCVWYNQSLGWRKSCGFCIKKDGDLCHVAPGGNKCWAAFSGDTAPALLCLSASVEVASARGTRRLPLEELYQNDGIAYLQLAPDELLTRIFLPHSMSGYAGAYLKLRLRGSIDYPLAGVAVALKSNGVVEDARIAITAVNPLPLLIPKAAASLIGRRLDRESATGAAEIASRVARPLTTSALTPEYRREMVRVYTQRALMKAAGQGSA